MANEIEKNGGGSGKSFETEFAAEILHAITQTITQHSNGESNGNGNGNAAICDPTKAANVAISPLLLEALLALLYLGSDGVTAQELTEKLQLKRFSSNAKMANYFAAMLDIATKDADSHIMLESQLLLRESLKYAEEFTKIASKYFQTSTQCDTKLPTTTTTSATKCNADNGEKESDGNAIALLTAELQFKWFLPFSAYRSGIYDFHMNAQTTTTSTTLTATTETTTAAESGTTTIVKPVAMLFDDDMFVKFGEFRELDARAIELPLEHELELSMLLLLPNKRDGLTELEQQLRQLNLNEFVDQRMQMQSVQVLLPKFQIDFECDVREAFEKLGIKTLFNGEGNFRNLLQKDADNKEHVKFSEIRHRVRLQVHESGSETCVSAPVAANKPIVLSNSIDTRQKFFRADHPFYFAIRNGDATFFVGHVRAF